MGTTVNNHNSGGDGTGLVILGVVGIVAISGIIALVLAALTVIVAGVAVGVTVFAGYKFRELSVWRTVSLAAIAAGMEPPPLRAARQIPTARELTVGRRGVA